ncbi:MAG: hypothetical protein NZL96_02220 [Patescibacteria group bacterium]|nr:hypothetical protein [Patescibacteria group bacterium]
MKINIGLILILIIAFLFRFNNLNWDQYQHLHPDERFLTLVGIKMIWPESLLEYLDPQRSKLNPFNLGEGFFVYGSFPLTIVKYLALNLNLDTYNYFNIVGRYVSAFLDFLVVILVYKVSKLFITQKIINFRSSFLRNYSPLLASFFYGVSVYPIQAAHFFTTDTFLNFFLFGSFYFCLRFSLSFSKSGFFTKIRLSRLFFLFVSAIFLGLAFGSKISAIVILPLNLAAMVSLWFLKVRDLVLTKKKISLLRHFLPLVFFVFLYLSMAYLSLRLTNPFYFNSANFFDLRLNNQFISSLKTLIALSREDAWYPPGVQWLNKPWWYLLTTTFFAGLGPVNFIVMLAGVSWYLKRIINHKPRKEELILILVLLWLVGLFFYQSIQFVKSIRYTLYLYPFFAFFGGLGIGVIIELLKSTDLFKTRKFFLNIFKIIVAFALLAWPILFSTIYLNKHTRVEASEWIYEKIPDRTIIAGEYWDDPLPLAVSNPQGKTIKIELLPIFDPDTLDKWRKMKEILTKAHYYILSSNRGWGSISTVPERYPIMTKFYESLLKQECFSLREFCSDKDCQPQIIIGSYSSDRFCFRKIKEFLPYYYQFLRYPENLIEETFTVYDHPTVMVFRKEN